MSNETIIDITPEKVEITGFISGRQKIAMLLFACLLIVAAYSISNKMNIKPYVSNNTINKIFIKNSYDKNPTPQTQISLGEKIPVKGYLSSSVNNTLITMQHNMDKISKSLDKQQAINIITHELYKSSNGNKSLSKEESRELLLRAGFAPPQEKQVVKLPKLKKIDPKEGIELTKGIAKELIRDEVQGFMLKVKLATQVGEYLFE